MLIRLAELNCLLSLERAARLKESPRLTLFIDLAGTSCPLRKAFKR
jgi:hypothetical protein